MAEQTERTDSEKSRRLKDAGGGAQQGRQAEAAERTEAAAARRAAAAAAAAPPAPALGEAAFSSEERECRVCYNPFDPDARAPKLLECLHTFCLDCLNQMQHHQAQGEGGGGSGSERGATAAERSAAPAAITCPLCRHRTVLPQGRARNLPLNTKLAPPRLPAERLQLLPLSRASGPALQRPLPGQSGHQATPSGDPAAAAAAAASTGCHEPPRQSSRQEIRTVRCVCIVFTFFSMMVISITGPLFLNYSGWVELFMVSLFLVVAIVLAVFSIMPYLRLLHTHEYRAVAAALLAGEGAGGPRGAALGPVTTPGRSLARAGQG